MKAYIISLNEPTEKINYLKSNGISPILIKGVNGKIASENEIVNHVSTFYKYFGPKSAIGCALSHLKTWKTFLETKDEYAIIFEDDIILEDDFVNKVNFYMEQVPKDYDILYLGCFGCDETQTPNIPKILGTIRGVSSIPIKVNDHIAIPTVAFATHAYVLSRQGAEKLIKELDGNIKDHIDICMQQLSSLNKIKSYVTIPRIAFQTSTDELVSTNISSSHPILLTKYLNKFYIDKMVRANYLSNVSFARIGNININTISVIYFILGIILIDVDLKYIILFYLLSIPDIYANSDLTIIIFHNFLLVLPKLMKYLYKNSRSFD